MLAKYHTISKIVEGGIVAIVRVEHADTAKKVVEAMIEGGLHAIEITFTVDKAYKIIEDVSNMIVQENIECILGAGTVLDAETARIAILSGAQYMISPVFDTATAKLCNRYAIPYMPGCHTASEIVRAMEYGVDIIKLFSCSERKPSIIKALSAPFPHVNIMPTGGISLDNAAEWIKAGAVALGVGGNLTSGIASGDFTSVSERAVAYRKAVQRAREEM